MARRVIVQSRFPQIVAELDRAVARAVERGAEGVVSEARNRVPVATGRLRDAIHVDEAEGGFMIVAGDDEAFYGHIVEFGSAHSSARPFLLPAFEARRASIEAAVKGALAGL
jgi:HK97 gp10 family phage protein